MTSKYYTFRVNQDGEIISPICASAVASDQRDALSRARMNREYRKIKRWAGTVVVLAPVHYDELDVVEYKDQWDYWVYNSAGECLPEGLVELG